MKDQWTELWKAVGCRGDAEAAYRQLVVAYGAPTRAYHNLTHIEACINLLDRVGGAQQRLACQWAFWFHDVIYVPGATDNEKRSAHISSQILENAGVGRGFERYVTRLILATHTGNKPVDKDGKLVVDIDHSILGESPETFDAYDRAVRQEFGSLPWPTYVERRARFLRAALEQRPYFHTDALQRSSFEDLVHANLACALARLTSHPDPLLQTP